MSKWGGLNRRKFPRVNYPCLVVVHTEEEGKKVSLLTHTENIGLGGVCLVMSQSLKMFSTVNLEIDLLDLNNHIKCSGKVVWNVQRNVDSDTKPLQYDIGLEFIGENKEYTDRLSNVVSRLVKGNKNLLT